MKSAYQFCKYRVQLFEFLSTLFLSGNILINISNLFIQFDCIRIYIIDY